jgi:Endoribonuclease L-PSP
MKREIIRVEPLSTWLERWKAPTSAVTRHGDTIYVSGFPPFDPATGEVIDAPIERQTELVLDQLKLCLETAGSSFGSHPQMQCLLHVGREVCRCQRDLLPLFPERPAGADFRERPSLARAFRYRGRLHRRGRDQKAGG